MKKTVITIARSYGSGGRTLGKLLAEQLGINCYDREILRMASDASGINEALFGKADERLKRSPLFGILKKNPYKGGVIPPENSVLCPMITCSIIRRRSSKSWASAGILRDYRPVCGLFTPG